MISMNHNIVGNLHILLLCTEIASLNFRYNLYATMKYHTLEYFGFWIGK